MTSLNKRMDDDNINSSVHERASLCESESSSVANMNYSGPDLETENTENTQREGGTNLNRELIEQRAFVVLFCHTRYMKSSTGVLRLLQVMAFAVCLDWISLFYFQTNLSGEGMLFIQILSVMSLISLTTSRSIDNEGFLLLPLSWHFRVMVFVLLLSLLTSLTIWTMNATGVILMLPVNWYFIDMVVYSVFSFLYLVGTSLVASAFDFYQKMDTAVPHTTIKQLIFCVVIGYICMVMYGLTALIGYRRWRKQHRLFKRRKLLEQEDEEDVDI